MLTMLHTVAHIIERLARISRKPRVSLHSTTVSTMAQISKAWPHHRTSLSAEEDSMMATVACFDGSERWHLGLRGLPVDAKPVQARVLQVAVVAEDLHLHVLVHGRLRVLYDEVLQWIGFRIVRVRSQQTPSRVCL